MMEESISLVINITKSDLKKFEDYFSDKYYINELLEKWIEQKLKLPDVINEIVNTIGNNDLVNLEYKKYMLILKKGDLHKIEKNKMDNIDKDLEAILYKLLIDENQDRLLNEKEINYMLEGGLDSTKTFPQGEISCFRQFESNTGTAKLNGIIIFIRKVLWSKLSNIVEKSRFTSIDEFIIYQINNLSI